MFQRINTRDHQLPEKEADPSASVLKMLWSSTNSWAPENLHSWVKSLISNCEVQLHQMWFTQVVVPKCASIMTKEENNSLVLGEAGKLPMTSTWHKLQHKPKVCRDKGPSQVAVLCGHRQLETCSLAGTDKPPGSQGLQGFSSATWCYFPPVHPQSQSVQSPLRS